MSGADQMLAPLRPVMECVAYGSLLLLPGANGENQHLLNTPLGERMPALGPAGTEKSSIILTEQFTNLKVARELGTSLSDLECLQVSIGFDNPFKFAPGQALRISAHRNLNPDWFFSCDYYRWGTDNRPALWPVNRERFTRSDVVDVRVRTIGRPLIPAPTILTVKLIGYELDRTPMEIGDRS